MSVNVGVVDWFTKIQTIMSPEDSEKKMSALIGSIQKKIDKKDDLTDLMQKTYEVLRASEFYNHICSDPKKPDCSLFHHSKNTSAIAICLALDCILKNPLVLHDCLEQYGLSDEQKKRYQQKDLIALIRLAAVINDIRKIRLYRLSGSGSEEAGSLAAKIVNGILGQLNAGTIIQRYGLDLVLPQLCRNLANDTKKENVETWIHLGEAVSSNQDCGDGSNVNIGYLALDIKRIQDYVGEADKLPMLNGGSAIVNAVLEKSRTLIAAQTCDECILFAGGGNLLALLPSDTGIQGKLKHAIEKCVTDISFGGLEAAVVIGHVSLNDMSLDFGKALKEIQHNLEDAKQSCQEVDIVLPKSVHHVCPFCNKRTRDKTEKWDDMCKVCEAKTKTSQNSKRSPDEEPDLLSQTRKNYPTLEKPVEITDLGDSIAVITIDGNMMGSLFFSSKTPAEYTFKSETFDRRFRETVQNTVEQFVKADCKDYPDDDPAKFGKSRIRVRGNIGEIFIALKPIYGGGDDLLLITSARAAIPLTLNLIKNIADTFMRNKKRAAKTSGPVGTPTVTISAGIAVAKSKFPIYFVIEQARRMEVQAKKAFRDACITTSNGEITMPTGSLAITAISGAMPSSGGIPFVISHDPVPSTTGGTIMDLVTTLDFSMEETYKRTVVDLITCSDRKEDRLNLIKSTYASTKRRASDNSPGQSPQKQIELAHYLARMLMHENEPVLKAAKIVVPHLWHHQQGEVT